MVIGFDKFQKWFERFSDNYIVIGGSACSWLMQREALHFRSTKDIDIVIIAENMSRDFAIAIWEFIQLGGYKAYERIDGKKCFYRFVKPQNEDFPYMLELFSRSPIELKEKNNGKIIPIPTNEEDVSSLSGILLDENYYTFIKEHSVVINGVSVLSPEALIVLKTHAWFDLMSKKALGEMIPSKELRKHRLDIVRLLMLVQENKKVALPKELHVNFKMFISEYEKNEINMKELGLEITFKEAISIIKEIFL